MFKYGSVLLHSNKTFLGLKKHVSMLLSKLKMCSYAPTRTTIQKYGKWTLVVLPSPFATRTTTCKSILRVQEQVPIYYCYYNNYYYYYYGSIIAQQRTCKGRLLVHFI